MKRGEFVEEIIITVRRLCNGGKILEGREFVIASLLDLHGHGAKADALLMKVDRVRKKVAAKHKEIFG